MTGLLAFALALVVTRLAVIPLRRIAQRLDIMDHPAHGAHKSHTEPVPYLGGLAILLGALVGLLLLPHYEALYALAGMVCALGLFDDVFHASVATKLIGQVAVAVAAIAFGFSWHVTDSPALNAGLSLVWIVGLTNAFNLLDNMDGLTATVAATALAGLVLIAPSTTPLALPMAGALVGFLLVNRPPARMYMGDAGSLLVGFTMALATISAADAARGLHAFVLLSGPVALGLLDTSLVIVSRLSTGRPVQLGGRDHFSHRLRILGWSRRSVLVGSFVATVAGITMAFLAGRYPSPEAWLAVPIALSLGGAWLRLLRIDPYSAGANSRPEVLSA